MGLSGLRYHLDMSHVFSRLRLLGAMLFFFSSLHAFAAVLREDIGELKIHDLLLRPSFLLKEPQQGSFSIGESSFALRWELEEKYYGVIRVGPRTLLNPLARYSETVNDDVTLVEAFAEFQSDYGRIRMGRLPVEFGYEGRLWERYLIFPRSLLFQKRAMMLRDVGFAYDIMENQFYTGFVIHNGESDDDEDGRTWYTARWGYKADKWELGLAGQTGSTKPKATNTSKDTLAGVDPQMEAQWRVGGIYTNINLRKFEWTLEYYMGEAVQSHDIKKFYSGHSDLGYQFSKRFSTHLRYDTFEPNSRQSDDIVRQGSIALMFSNTTHSSNLILVGTKIFEQGAQVANDELRIMWSLSPSGVVRF